jgi:hypothetical protein
VALQDVRLDAWTPFEDERLATREPPAHIPHEKHRRAINVRRTLSSTILLSEDHNFAIFLNIHKTKASLCLSASQQSQNELEVKFEVDLLSVPP